MMGRLAALEIKHVLYRVPLHVVSAFHMQPCADPHHWGEKHLRIVFPWALHYYLRILIRPLRNWWHSHSWLHVTDTEWKTQEMPKHKQANCSITKKGRKHCFIFLLFIGTSKFSSVINHSEVPACLRMAVLLKVKT